jgi:hypothetical protein
VENLGFLFASCFATPETKDKKVGNIRLSFASDLSRNPGWQLSAWILSARVEARWYTSVQSSGRPAMAFALETLQTGSAILVESAMETRELSTFSLPFSVLDCGAITLGGSMCFPDERLPTTVLDEVLLQSQGQ